MKSRSVMLAAALVVGTAAAGRAFDNVQTTSTTLIGRVSSASQTKIVLEKGAAGLTEEVPINELVMVYLEDDPQPMKNARLHLNNGRYEDALSSMEKVDVSQVGNPLVRQDVEYYKAYCKAQIALGGGGGPNAIVDAGKAMAAFLGSNSGSYHLYEAYEIMGDLAAAGGYYPKAAEYYGFVATAPWPDYQMRAKVAVGRALLAEKKYPEAQKVFDEVLAIQAQGDLADSQRMAATLGNARVMAATNKPDVAIKMVEGIIAKADPEQTDLLARAYNTLGSALRLAKRDKEALLAFLHVDVLYTGVPEAHAEALYNLEALWNKLGMPERAQRARNLLDEHYGNSPWAKQGG